MKTLITFIAVCFCMLTCFLQTENNVNIIQEDSINVVSQSSASKGVLGFSDITIGHVNNEAVLNNIQELSRIQSIGSDCSKRLYSCFCLKQNQVSTFSQKSIKSTKNTSHTPTSISGRTLLNFIQILQV